MAYVRRFETGRGGDDVVGGSGRQTLVVSAGRLPYYADW